MRSCRKDLNNGELIKKYHNFLNKYYVMFAEGVINFENYDLRYFLSCYLKDKEDRRSLRKGKYHSKEDIANAYHVLKYLKKAFIGFNNKEIYHELLIPFLKCVNDYQEKNSHFKNYLYKTYKYNLMRHLNTLLFKRHGYIESEKFFVSFPKDEEEKENTLVMDPGLELHHPLWLKGETARDPFNKFTREERLILIKYYLESKTDKEIGRLIGKSRKYINRKRNKIVNDIKEKLDRKEIKWARWIP